MARMAREQWLGIARDLGWELSYVDYEAVFPEWMSGQGKIPREAWSRWEEPYRVTWALSGTAAPISAYRLSERDLRPHANVRGAAVGVRCADQGGRQPWQRRAEPVADGNIEALLPDVD